MRGIQAGLVLFFAGCGPTPDVYEPVDVTTGSSAQAWDRASTDASDRVRRERFDLADHGNPLADYLFILDSSSSMRRVVERVQSGFDSLAEGDAFPPRARIAVMNMVPGNYADLSTRHAAVRDANGSWRPPGFLTPMDAISIEAFRQAHPRMDAREPMMAGCDAWFEPAALSSEGYRCLTAHTQPLESSGTEAGAHVLKQMLLAANGPSFRSGATVNVVFVSDTHDPGSVRRRLPEERAKGYAELLQTTPTFSELRALVDRDNDVAAFRLHAVAPEERCSESWVDAPIYNDLADASGGLRVDICTEDDFTDFIRQMAELGTQRTLPVYALSETPEEVVSVRVDDEPTPWTAGPQGDTIHLLGMPQGTSVDVLYRRQAASPEPATPSPVTQGGQRATKAVSIRRPPHARVPTGITSPTPGLPTGGVVAPIGPSSATLPGGRGRGTR